MKPSDAGGFIGQVSDYCLLTLSEATIIVILYVQVTVHRDKLRLNNQLDASTVQNKFCHETLHVSGIFCTRHQDLSAVHVAVGMFHAGYVAAA